MYRKLQCTRVWLALANIRQRHWTPQGEATASVDINKDVDCKVNAPKMPPPPDTRIELSRPFQHDGLGYSGVVGAATDADQKVWVWLFTCTDMHDIHNEVAFPILQEVQLTFHRFAARRNHHPATTTSQ